MPRVVQTTDSLLPRGFRAAGVHCGIKQDPGKLDLALFVAHGPCTAAGVFTQNRVVGAPVKVSRARLPRETARAVIINSGNANACTGNRGLADARWMTAELANLVRCPEDDVLVCSTGVIGHFLPRETLARGIPAAFDALDSTADALESAARGMMTTDTAPKLSMRRLELGGTAVTVTGVAKGAAMIGPNMATMLAVVLTDAALSSAQADSVLRHAVERSFNCISVEGHTSTSDSVLLLASGAAKHASASKSARLTASQRDAGSIEISSDTDSFQQALTEVCTDLAQQIIRDAEGAGHFVTIDVRGARTPEEARSIAKTVADGPLVKTAIAGNDPNWGRIVSAAGYSGVELREEDIMLRLNGTLLYQSGIPAEFDEPAVSRSMAAGEVHIELDLAQGESSIRFWTSDLTAEYVRLNAEYTT